MSASIVNSGAAEFSLSSPNLLAAACNSAPICSHDLSVPKLVAFWAKSTPYAAAVVADNEVMTYAELDARANRLANYLIDVGVGRETIVGLCLNRSPESVLSALAVMKAGGAFLPLDPGYPIDRLAFMLNDAQPRVLITRSEFATKVPASTCKVIHLNRDRDIESYSCDPPALDVADDQLAYVIYTSGSTGQPKGVEIEHQSLLNLINWHRREFEVTSLDRASHLAGVGFDAAVWEVWPYLTAGASLHLPDEETRVSPESLRNWLAANEITISFLPTPLAETLMTFDWPPNTALRFLLTGADTLHRRPSSSLPFQLVNNYGPTECTIVATSGRVKSEVGGCGLPTIGRPIANTEVYILDEDLQPVAPGESGELFIGGAGVARGYLNRPDLTAVRFIELDGSRLYHTGDLVRLLDNGEIAYLGRVDEQIQILGYRVEPGEIEAAINRHPAIASSVVVARSAREEKRLTAYLVMRNGTTPVTMELRDFLRSTLPDYMVPSIFVKLATLPLTPNGKVDRAALPEPGVENTLRDEEFIAPRSPIEERLATILRSLLNLNEVSVNDNFFLLGGHSLLGAQLVVKIRGAFGVDLSLRTLFDMPTIAELSSEIERLMIERIESMSEDEALALLA